MNVGRWKIFNPETDCSTENIHSTSELVCSLANLKGKIDSSSITRRSHKSKTTFEQKLE